MSQDYSPSLVTKNLVFCGDAAMKSAAGPATLLYDKVNDNNGTMYNGTCFDFDGTDDLVLTNNAVITGTGDFTLTAWINRATVNTTDFICGNYSGTNPSGIEFYGINTGEVRCYILGSVTTSTALVADTWYHVGVRRLAGVVQLYINGVADGSAISRTTSITGTLNFAIGNGPDYTSENFDGKIADVKAFNVALSAANMKELYDDSKVIIPTKNAAAGGFVSQTNLIGWWPLAEGAGDICYDGSGNGYHGTASNTDGDEWLTGKTGVPQLVEGYNRKLLFSGDDDVDCGNDSSLNFTTSNFSISCWVYIHDLTDVGYIVRRGGWGSNGWYTYLTSSRTLQIYTNDSAQGDPHTQTTSNSSVITANTWHHVVWVRNGATGVIYVDGTDETASGDSMIDPATSTNNCYIGHSYIAGIVDEVIVYDTVVTSSQAAALHATDANGGPLPPDPMSGASGLPSTGNVQAYWRNEGPATWPDRSSNSNDGTPTTAGALSSLLFKQGYNGQKNVNTGRDNQGFPLKFKNVGAVGFNGVDDYIAVADSPAAIHAGTQLSISANIYEPTLTHGGIVKKWATAGQKSWMFYVSTNGKMYLMISSDGTNAEEEYSVGTITAGVWNDIAVTFNAGTFKAYINGVDVGVGANFSTELSVFAGSDPINIGYANWAGYYFEGQMANVRLYNRALTYAEIQQNYNSFKSRFGE